MNTNNVEIYEVNFLTRQIVLPSMRHIDIFLTKYQDLLTPTLLNSIRIIPITVSRNSEDYKTALHNSFCLKA